MSTKKFWRPLTCRDLEEEFYVFIECNGKTRDGRPKYNVVERLPGKPPYFVVVDCATGGVFQRACNFVRKHRLKPGMHYGYQSINKPHYEPEKE